MEESLIAAIRKEFELGEIDIRTYSPLVLAYIGDDVYDLVIRTIMVGKGNSSPSKLHHRTAQVVKAHSQAVAIEALLPTLSDEEKDVYRRGRNAKSNTMAKHASVADYRKATGFEALVGYLYLQDQMPRILELIKAVAVLDNDSKGDKAKGTKQTSQKNK